MSNYFPANGFRPDVKAKFSLSKGLSFGFQEVLDKIIKTCLFLLFFLFPVFFLPSTSDILEFNKQYLLLFFILIAFFCWLLKITIEKKFSLLKTPLNIFLLVFIVIYLGSCLFSLDKYISFWGFGNSVASSFISVLSFVLLFWIILNNFFPGIYKKLIISFLAGSFVSAVIFILQANGIFLLPFGFSGNVSFNLVGTVNSAAIFFGFISVMSVGLLLRQKSDIHKENFYDIFLIISLLSSLYCAGISNFKFVWLSLAFSMLIMIVFSTLKITKINDKIALLPMALFMLSIFFYFAGFPLGAKNLPAEMTLNNSVSFQIAKDTLLKSPLLGFGPGNFDLAYLRFKPSQINDTSFWDVSFNKPYSEIYNITVASGIFGLLSFLLIIIFFIFYAFLYLIKKEVTKDWLFLLTLLCSVVLIFANYFFYYNNLTLAFCLWFSLAFACLIISENNNRTGVSFEKSPQISVIFSFVSIFLMIVVVGLMFIAGQRYLADIYYTKGAVLSQSVQTNSLSQNIANLEKTILFLDKSIKYNQNFDEYFRVFSKAVLMRINQEFNLEPTDQTKKNIQFLTDLAVNNSKRATEINGKRPANWVSLGVVYQNISGYTVGASEWAIKSYLEAIKYDPKNPVLKTDLAKLYILRSDELASLLEIEKKNEKLDKIKEYTDERNKNLEQAMNNLLEALEIKKDYTPASYQIALVYARQDKIDEAIKKLESLRDSAPTDVGIRFQLAMLYLQSKKTEEAQKELEAAVSLMPSFSNARWYLASIYENDDKTEEAIKQLEKILELNPNDKTVSEKLDQLKNGTSKPVEIPQPIEEIKPDSQPVEE